MPNASARSRSAASARRLEYGPPKTRSGVFTLRCIACSIFRSSRLHCFDTRCGKGPVLEPSGTYVRRDVRDRMASVVDAEALRIVAEVRAAFETGSYDAGIAAAVYQ